MPSAWLSGTCTRRGQPDLGDRGAGAGRTVGAGRAAAATTRPRRHRYPGRRPVGDRAALAGIMFVLKTGIAWNQLPAGLAGCSGITCWRRLRDWTEAGVWPALHQLLLDQLRALGELDLDRCPTMQWSGGLATAGGGGPVLLAILT